MQINKFSDIHKIIADGKYKYISLETKEGKTVIGFNGLQHEREARIKEIETRLKSPALADGEYRILLKNTQFKNVKPDEVTITKGNAQSNAPAQILSNQSPEVLTWEEAKKMYSEIAEYKAKVELLQKELDNLKKELIEEQDYCKGLEEDLKEYENQEPGTAAAPIQESPNLSEPKSSFLSGLSEILPGIKSIAEVFIINKENSNKAALEQAAALKDLADQLKKLNGAGQQHQHRNQDQNQEQFNQDPGTITEEEGTVLDYLQALKEQKPEEYKNFLYQINIARNGSTDQEQGN